jgi:alpha-glucosidase (family GH31 glycosyl hydrolase)
MWSLEPAMLSHRPFGSEHPYRYDLDQRVPPRPLAGEEYEIRVLAAEATTAVTVAFADGTRVAAERVSPAALQLDHGPRPAPAPEVDGHLSAVAAAPLTPAGQQAWRARVRAAGDTSYQIVADDEASAWYDITPLSWRADGGQLIVEGIDRLVPDSLCWLVDSAGPRRVRFALRLDPAAHVLGFGERFDRVDQRGQSLDVTVFEQYKHQGQRSYLPMPFALVVTPGEPGWGFHLRTTRRSRYEVGDVLRVEVDVDPADPSLTLRLYEGAPSTVVHAFLAETGPAKLPPDWVFRPWVSGNEWNTQARVLAEVERSLAEGIPVGAVVIEAWSDEETFVAFRDAVYTVHDDGAPHRLSDFTFPPDGAWPDPRSMVDRLHALDVKVLLWQIPLIPTDRGHDGQVGADARTLVARNLAVREADGSPYHNRGWWFPGAVLPDFTNPAATTWWLDKRRYLVDELGIDGFKTDGGEHAWGHDLRYADGTRGDDSNNRFPVLYAAAYHQLTEVTFSRAGFTGSAANPCHWAGDEDSTWAAYRASITAGLTAGIGGIFFWGWDLGGFSGEIPDAELYLRSAAMACFCPIMQYHSEFNHHRTPSRDRTPWNIAERTGSPDVLPVFRQFATLRESLVAYLVEQAGLSVHSGAPLMRPLCFDHPDDERIFDWPLQYQLGNELLVAPVTEPGATTWPVYLPLGEWEDFFTGERHTGPIEVDRPVPLNEIPVYRRVR